MAESSKAPLIENIIPILRVQDMATSVDYYQQRLGFRVEWSTDDIAGLVRDGWHLYLSTGEHGEPGMWLWVGVAGVDQIYQECRAQGATIKSEIQSHPWAREFQVVDPDGHVLRFAGAAAGGEGD